MFANSCRFAFSLCALFLVGACAGNNKSVKATSSMNEVRATETSGFGMASGESIVVSTHSEPQLDPTSRYMVNADTVVVTTAKDVAYASVQAEKKCKISSRTATLQSQTSASDNPMQVFTFACQP